MKKSSAVRPVRLNEMLSQAHLKAMLLATSVLAVFLSTATVPAHADTFSGGVVVQGETFDPYHPTAPPAYKTLFSNAGVITLSLQRAWHQKSDDICTSLQAALGKADSLGKGYSAYNITCSMGDASNIQIAATAITNGIHLTLAIPGNNLAFTSTQPTVCGSECDPRFSVAYDLSVGLDVHTSGTQITVANVAAKIRNPKVDSHNVAADLIEALVGQQFLDNLVGRINYHGADLSNMVNSNLGVLNALIGGLAQQNGYQHLAITLEHSQVATVPPTSVLLQLSKDTFNIPLQGNGQISGAIRWDSKAGTPASCSTMGVAAKATVGYQQQDQFIPPQTVVGNVQIAALKQNGGVSECDYVISGLPYNIPLEIDATANGAWTGPDAYDLKSPRPDGWTGHVTVEQPSTMVAQPAIRTQSATSNVVQLNPAPAASAPAFPGSRRAMPTARPVLHTSFVTMTQNNPRGLGKVGGIDFAISFQEPPR